MSLPLPQRTTQWVLPLVLGMALLAGPAWAAPEAAAAFRPRIGITGLRSAKEDLTKLKTYWGAVERNGGEPVALFYGDPVDAKALDGIIFAGGEDVDPSYYGEKPDPTVAVNADRDRSEMAQAELALKAQLPILGICRGSQLLNVRLGGSLVQDIPSQVTGALAHGGGVFHAVTIQPGTRLAQTVSLHALKVNSYHHQAVKKLAPGLRITARSDDGVVEGWEATPGGPIRSWVSGVQFHPEKPDFPEATVSQEVFAAFIAEARAFHQQKMATPALSH